MVGRILGGLAAIWPIIAVAFPLLELFGIIRIWDFLGYWALLWLSLAVVAGAGLIALERTAILPALAASVLSGRQPLEALKTSGLRLLAGLLLILPGAVSDALGLLILIRVGLRSPPPPPSSPGQRATPAATGDGELIEGDYRRID